MKVDHLWAPWRLEYIKGNKPGVCPFCEAPEHGPSPESLVLYSDDLAFVILNKFPYNPGHVMVIPREHQGKPDALADNVWVHCARMVRETEKCLETALEPQGFNIGMNVGAAGGAGIPGHLHWHILPRWNGDTNFMPLLADTKAIPSHNLETYKKLAPYFENFGARLAP